METNMSDSITLHAICKLNSPKRPESLPSGHTAFIQRRINVDATA